MTNQANERRNLPRWLIWPPLGLILLLGAMFLTFLTGADERPLKPFLPSPTADVVDVDGQPMLVTFTQLNENPLSFQGKRIRVTGDYTPLPPPGCTPFSGHSARWALITENLQMDAVGFEQVLRLVPSGASLTVDGIWRSYQGPLGCGKQPPDSIAWYLDAEQIVQPNPLFVSGSAAGATAVELLDASTPAGQPSATPPTLEPTAATPGRPTSTPDPAATHTFTPTPTIAPTNGATATPVVGDATSTSTPPAMTVIATPTADPTVATPTSTGTAQPNGTATLTPTITRTPTPGPTQPPLVTATDSYPGPAPTETTTLTPTATPEPYG